MTYLHPFLWPLGGQTQRPDVRMLFPFNAFIHDNQGDIIVNCEVIVIRVHYYSVKYCTNDACVCQVFQLIK